MAKDGDSIRLVRGINPGFECFPVGGAHHESLGHVSSRTSQIPPATRITTASSADAINRRRVCIWQVEGNSTAH